MVLYPFIRADSYDYHPSFNLNSDRSDIKKTHTVSKECYVSILYTSQIAIIKHYKDEHEIVITAKQVTDDCLLNDQKQINQMIEEGRVEGGSEQEHRQT